MIEKSEVDIFCCAWYFPFLFLLVTICFNRGLFAAPEMQSIGFIFVKIRGGFHEIRNAVRYPLVHNRLAFKYSSNLLGFNCLADF